MSKEHKIPSALLNEHINSVLIPQSFIKHKSYQKKPLHPQKETAILKLEKRKKINQKFQNEPSY